MVDCSVCFHQIKMQSNSELLKIQQYIFKHVFFCTELFNTRIELYRFKVADFVKFSFTEESTSLLSNNIFRLVSLAHV